MLDNDIFEDYKDNGVTHLFAISGMHITLFAGVIDKLLKLFKVKENKRLVFISLFLVFYAFITGFSSSIKRALVFVICNTINKIFKFNLKTIDILYIALSLLLITNRYLIYDIGFLYSAIISFGIIKYSQVVKSSSKLKESLKLSCLTFFFSLPLSLYFYYEINFLGILNNLYYIPWISLIIYPLCLLTTLIHPLCYILEALINITEIITRIVSKITLFKLILPFSFKAVIVYYIFLFLCLSKKRIYFLLITCEILFLKVKPFFDNNAYVYFLDVSQGDSAIVITPYQKEVIMIDTGGKISYKKDNNLKRNKEYHLSDSTITFLKSLNINKIDKLIISHGDFDHMGEASYLINNFKINEIIFNCGGYNNLETNLIKDLNKKKIPYFSCCKKTVINDKISLLNSGNYDNENNNSIIAYIKLSNYTFLFMGDASVEVEQNLIKKYNLKNIDVLKIGHHGSKTSSSKEFIQKVNPKYSIISVGKNNRYGHPDNEVLNILRNKEVYRTDINGSIKFTIRENNLDINYYKP